MCGVCPYKDREKDLLNLHSSATLLLVVTNQTIFKSVGVVFSGEDLNVEWFFFSSASGIKVGKNIFTVIQPANGGAVPAPLKYIHLYGIVSCENGFLKFSIQKSFEFEGSGFKILAIPLRLITGDESDQQ